MKICKFTYIAAACFIMMLTSGCLHMVRNNTDALTPSQTAASPSVSFDFSAEAAVSTLLRSADQNTADFNKVFTELPDINWTEYDSYTKGKAIDLIAWLYTANYRDDAQLLCLMRATSGLDGYMTEGYCGVLSKVITTDTKSFIACLAQMDQQEADQLCGYAAYGCGYRGETEPSRAALAEVKALLDDGTLTLEERTSAEKLLKALNKEAG